MALSNKLIADYIELINQALDSIPAQEPEDFVLVTEALRGILNPETEHDIPPKLQDAISSIADYVNSPEMYVQYEDDYDEYRQIIKDRIAAKINEFRSLDDAEKQSYVNEQKTQRAQSVQNKEIMSKHEPPQPGSEAHTLSDEEWLQERQQQFQEEDTTRENTTIDFLVSGLDVPREIIAQLNDNPRAESLFLLAGIRAHLESINPDVLREFLAHPDDVINLVQQDVSIPDLSNLWQANPDSLKAVLRYSTSTLSLIARGITINDLMTIKQNENCNDLRAALNGSERLIDLMDNHNATVVDLKALWHSSPNSLTLLLAFRGAAPKLLDSGITIKELAALGQVDNDPAISAPALNTAVVVPDQFIALMNYENISFAKILSMAEANHNSLDHVLCHLNSTFDLFDQGITIEDLSTLGQADEKADALLDILKNPNSEKSQQWILEHSSKPEQDSSLKP